MSFNPFSTLKGTYTWRLAQGPTTEQWLSLALTSRLQALNHCSILAPHASESPALFTVPLTQRPLPTHVMAIRAKFECSLWLKSSPYQYLLCHPPSHSCTLSVWFPYSEHWLFNLLASQMFKAYLTTFLFYRAFPSLASPLRSPPLLNVSFTFAVSVTSGSIDLCETQQAFNESLLCARCGGQTRRRY